MALKNEGIRSRAEDLYCYSDFNQSEICEICGISEKTLREWRDKYAWEDTKKSNAITTPKIIARLQKRLYELSEKEDASEDRIVKLTSSIDKLRGRELYLFNYIEVFKGLTEYLFTKGDEKKVLTFEDREITLNGVEAGKLLNLYMKDFISQKIHGRR